MNRVESHGWLQPALPENPEKKRGASIGSYSHNEIFHKSTCTGTDTCPTEQVSVSVRVSSRARARVRVRVRVWVRAWVRARARVSDRVRT